MDLTAFYATISGVGFTLLGLWWVVVDKHPEWFSSRVTAQMAYVVSLQFMLPAATSVLSMVAPAQPLVWRVVFALMGLVGIGATVLVARSIPRGMRRSARLALVVGAPVYAAVILVAVFPSIAAPLGFSGLQTEAFLIALILLLGLHAVWFFTYRAGPDTSIPEGRG